MRRPKRAARSLELAQQRRRHRSRSEQVQREMALEAPTMLWLKFLTCAIGLGSLIEITSAIGKFYKFKPSWGAFAVIFGGFGFSLGTISLRVNGATCPSPPSCSNTLTSSSSAEFAASKASASS